MTGNTYDGRVSNAILATKLDHITELLSAVITDGKKRDDRIATLESDGAVNRQRWGNHKDLHVRERGLLGIGSVVGSLVAGILGVFVDKP